MFACVSVCVCEFEELYVFYQFARDGSCVYSSMGMRKMRTS